MGDPKIGNGRVPKTVEKDISRLEVTVDNPLGMDGIQRRSDLRNDLGGITIRQRPILDLTGKGASRHIAHHQVKLIIVLAIIIDRHDRRMLDLCDQVRFPLEAFPENKVLLED